MTERPDAYALEYLVRTSNWVEGIGAHPGDLHYDRHYEAAQRVFFEHDRLVSPVDIHATLMRGIMNDAGSHRICEMGVGDRHMPLQEHVPMLMHALQDRMEDFLWANEPEHPLLDVELLAEELFNLHAAGLCIHPFRDGNGRTFRLWLVQLEWYYSLPLTVVTVPWLELASALDEAKYPEFSFIRQQDYYERIRAYEDDFFRPANVRVYE